MNKLPTIFGDNSVSKHTIEAIKSLVTGHTPIGEIRERESRGGSVKYVNTYYMTRQASLITGFRWSSKCLQEKFRPSESEPKEIGCLMEVTLFDQDGNAYSQQSWGSSDVKRYKDKGKDHNPGDIISLFDDLKGAYSDGIKKCLSYFGIANDIYGGKDLNYFEEEVENGQQSGIIISNPTEMRTSFDSYAKKNHVRYDIILRLLNVSTMNEVTDWTAAYKTVKEWIEGGRKEA
jgi:hypothetical protein